MRSTFGGLEIGKRGLFAQQTALNTVGHNISNANTDGYSKQRVNMEASRPIPVPTMTNDVYAGQTGTGVVVTDITRLRDEYLDRQYRNENKYVGYYEARQQTLSKIEMILKEATDDETVGLQPALDRLWGAWQDLANGPDSGEVREEVIGYAQGLTDIFTHISTSLKQQQSDLNYQISVTVDKINSIAVQISELNAQIARIRPHGYTTNDLDDQRDYLIDQLSKIIDVQVTKGDNGMLNVTIAGGHALVTGRTYAPLETSIDGNGFIQVDGIDGATSGSLLEYVESRGYIDEDGNLAGVIPDLLNKINSLAEVLSREINDLHRTGQNKIDIADPDPNKTSNLPFFISKKWYEAQTDKTLTTIDFASMTDEEMKALYPTGADDIIVNPLIVNNSDLLAAAGTPATGISDGRNAQAIADIKHKVITIGLPAQMTIDDFYASIIGKIGVDAQQAKNLLTTKQYLVNHVESKREAVMGVSLDEEMIDMIRYQQAYSASARVITAMDEVLDKIINSMGIVGR